MPRSFGVSLSLSRKESAAWINCESWPCWLRLERLGIGLSASCARRRDADAVIPKSTQNRIRRMEAAPLRDGIGRDSRHQHDRERVMERSELGWPDGSGRA